MIKQFYCSTAKKLLLFSSMFRNKKYTLIFKCFTCVKDCKKGFSKLTLDVECTTDAFLKTITCFYTLQDFAT